MGGFYFGPEAVTDVILDTAIPFWTGGGFTGSKRVISSVSHARNLGDDAHVILRGHIERHVGGDVYTFRDNTGSMEAVIGSNMWDGQHISPADTVQIYGVMDGSREIEVRHLTKVN